MHSIWWSVYQYVPIKGQIRDIMHMLNSNSVCKYCNSAILVRKTVYDFQSPISVCLEKQHIAAWGFLSCTIPIRIL